MNFVREIGNNFTSKISIRQVGRSVRHRTVQRNIQFGLNDDGCAQLVCFTLSRQIFQKSMRDL